MAVLAEEAREVLEESDGGLPENARQLLETVTDTLSTVTATLPYPSTIPLITKVSSAVDLLLSSPPSIPPISLLPAELFARIVHFRQDEDLRLRQCTNLALSRISRSFYLAVRPLLSANAHLWTPAQLIRFADEIDGNDKAKQAIRSLTTDFRTEDLTWKGSGATWAGRRFLSLVRELLRRKKLEHLRIRARDGPVEGAENEDWVEEEEPMGYLHLAAALGIDDDQVHTLWDGFSVPHLELPMPNEHADVSTVVDMILRAASDPTRQSLWIGNDEFPHSFNPETLHTNLLKRQKDFGKGFSSVPFCPSFRHLRVLAIPFVTVYPVDFLYLLGPPSAPPSAPSSISPSPRNRLLHATALADIFFLISPSLSHFTLRIISPDDTWEQDDKISKALGDALGICQRLTALSLGGAISEKACTGIGKLGALEHLAFLPNSGGLNPYGLTEKLSLPAGLKTLTCDHGAFAFEPHMANWFDEMVDTCRSYGTTFTTQKRVKETKWLKSF